MQRSFNIDGYLAVFFLAASGVLFTMGSRVFLLTGAASFLFAGTGLPSKDHYNQLCARTVFAVLFVLIFLLIFCQPLMR